MITAFLKVTDCKIDSNFDCDLTVFIPTQLFPT